MAVRICETCGAENDASERFCTTCHAYLWWDSAEEATADSVGGTTPVDDPAALLGTGTGGDAASAEAGASTTTAQASLPEPPQAPGTDGVDVSQSRARHAVPPTVAVQAPEATLGADGTATVVFEVTNPSEIVDGYDVVPREPPGWLVISTEDAHLMPGETRQIAIRLASESDEMILAQRVPVSFDVVSQADPTCRADAAIDVVVPPAGPRLAMTARPALLRLQDVAAGEFTLVLDNHASNHPQTLQLSASDSENAVRFAFDRTRLTVRPGAVEELTVAFSAPLPEQGSEVTRQITVTGQHDEGPVAATLTVVQRTRPAPVDEPLRVQLTPAHLTSVNGADSDFDVVLDNRGGHGARTVVLSARDPENRLAFAFNPRELVVPPEGSATARGRVRTAPPAPGTTETQPFTVIASDGKVDTEAEGVLESSATPDPMSTAALFVQPQHLDLGSARRGEFRVDVDNRRGLEPLRVRLSGSSDDGAASLRFHPADLVVAPRSTAAVHLAVEAPRPPARESITRQLTLQASDGREAVVANASLTQARGDSRPAWSRVLVIFGVLFVVIGSFMSWFLFSDARLPTIEGFLGIIQSGAYADGWPYLVEAGMRVLVLVLAVMMAFGMTGQSGGLTRKSAVLIVLLTVGLVIAGAVAGVIAGPGFGLFVVWFGAVLGYAGGVLAKQR